MERIREYIRKHKSFCIVLAVAVGINLVAVGVLVYLEKTFKNITISVDGKTLEHKTTADTVDDLLKKFEEVSGTKLNNDRMLLAKD